MPTTRAALRRGLYPAVILMKSSEVILVVWTVRGLGLGVFRLREFEARSTQTPVHLALAAVAARFDHSQSS